LPFQPPVPITAAATRVNVLHDDTVLFHDPKGAWFWRFDPHSASWTNVPQTSEPRRAPTILVGGEHLFLWGGSTTIESAGGCAEGAACEPVEAREVRRTDGAMLRL